MKIKHYLDFSGQFPYIFLRIILSLEFRTLCLRGPQTIKESLRARYLRRLFFNALESSFQFG